ncbi:MAG TPA: aminoglycoside phosphotransferase family protein, partial [Solirubrobacteraceae bacterium]|nr:aminoglycoside phosphotransferase family protein [Solirubrobacteraceae bacterium]
GAVVSGPRGERGRTRLDEALAGASAATGRSLHVVSATMTDSGKLLARVADDRRQQRFLLRVAGGSSGALIESAAASTRLLSAPAVAPAVRERVVAPLAVGAVGGVRYALEAEAAGRHPRRMTGALWDDCLEFLVALHAADGHPAPDADGVRAIVADDVRLVAPALEARGLERLQRLADGLAERLAAVPLGWAHGDFWPQNLLVRSQRLTAVIDWDDAAAGRLPLLDLLDLRGVSDPGTRRLTPGPRLERVLLPLARRSGDEPIRRYCAATGIPAEPELLEALVLGWWLQRVAHDLRDCPDKLARPRWLEDNVAAPLAVLAAR